MNSNQNLSDVPIEFKQYLQTFLEFFKKKLKDDLLSLILYGSVARGNWNEESDIDLLLIISNKFYKKFDNSKISEISIHFYNKTRDTSLYEEMLFHPLSILSLSLNQLESFRTLFYDIAVDGIIIYDPKDIGLKFLKKYRKRIKKKICKEFMLVRMIFIGNEII